MNDEWSLIVFTLLSQFSIGFIFYYTYFWIFKNKEVIKFASGFNLKSPDLKLVSVMFFATLFSFLHVGNPGNAYNSLNNIWSSWLSIEILGVSAFGIGVLLIFLSRSVLKVSNRVTGIIVVYTMFSGTFLLIAMCKLYMLPTVPTWNTWHTPVNFVVAAGILGSVGMVWFALRNGLVLKNYLKAIWILLILLLALELFFSYLHQVELKRILSMGFNNSKLEQILHSDLYFLRVVITLITIVLCSILFPKINAKAKSTNIILFIIIVLILTEQIIGRYMFYGSYVRLGV